jgi:type IV pilus assembly protein PilV
MIEVLVTIVIIAFGLLGMAGLQVRLQMSEMESYQRSQALLLLNDIANRISVNRTAAAAGLYVVDADAPLGAGMACPDATGTQAERDLNEWCNALQGASEVSGGGTSVGAMVGGRGCVEAVDGDFLVTVAWQGLTPIAAPPASVGCGVDAYNATSGSCVNDLCRRAVTTLVRIANLL